MLNSPQGQRCPHFAQVALCLSLAWLAGCASTPLPEGDGSQRVVTRTSNATVWATPEAALAAAAPPAAAARPASARPLGSAPAAAGTPAGSAVRAGSAAGAGAPVAAAAAAGPGPAGATTSPAPAAVAAVLAQTLFFDFDRFDIKEEFKPLLEGHAQVLLADRSLQLVVEGHADERGGAEYNLALGQKRAHAVVKALALLGVDESRVEAVSFGDSRPVVPDSNEQAWARNRRAEIKRR